MIYLQLQTSKYEVIRKGLPYLIKMLTWTNISVVYFETKKISQFLIHEKCIKYEHFMDLLNLLFRFIESVEKISH